VHGFEVDGILFDDLLEASPLFDDTGIFLVAAGVIFLYKSIKLFIKQFYFFLGALIYFSRPLHRELN
jgi:hypothetical protein